MLRSNGKEKCVRRTLSDVSLVPALRVFSEHPPPHDHMYVSRAPEVVHLPD